MKILIVEDDPFVADDLADQLIKLQYRVIGAAESYEKALELIRSEKPDLALVDIELKGELTGIDLSEQLNLQGIRFIYLSGIQDLTTYQKARMTGPIKNLSKPIDSVNLRNALLDIELESKSSGQSERLHFLTDKEGVRRRIDPSNIVYLEAARSYCDIYFQDESKSTLSVAMGNVVKKLNHPDLIQISRFHYVNRSHILRIRGNEVQLAVGPYLRISDAHRDTFGRMVNIL